MSINLADVLTTKLSMTKDCVADPTGLHTTWRLNQSGATYNSDGAGTGASATSTAVLCHIGGFADQKIVAAMKFVAPSTTANYEIGVMLRVQTLETLPDATQETYYYARVKAGTASIQKVVGNVFTSLASHAYALALNTYVDITFSVIGTALSATFHDESLVLADQTLSVTDSSISAAGLMGWKSVTSTIAVKSWTCSQP